MQPVDLSQVAIVEIVLGAMIGILLVVVILLYTRLRRIKSPAAGPDHPELEPASTVSPIRRLEQDLAFVVDYIKEFPKLMADLNSQTEVRQLPPVLLNAMVRIFRAEQAVVLVRRRSTLVEPERRNRLIVAALASSERGLNVGTEVAIGEGQLGYRGRDPQDHGLARLPAAIRDDPRHTMGIRASRCSRWRLRWSTTARPWASSPSPGRSVTTRRRRR